MNLRKDEKFITYIAAPGKIIKSSESKNPANKTKAKRLEAGKKALEEQDKAKDDGTQVSAEGSGVTPAQPVDTSLAAQSLLLLSSGSYVGVVNALKQAGGPQHER